VTLNVEKPLELETYLTRSNGLRAYARTQRKPPYVGVHDSPEASHVKSHVAHEKQTVGEHDADSKAQDQSRTTGTLGKSHSSRPQGTFRLGYSVPYRTSQKAVDARSQRREGVGFDTTRRNTSRALGMPRLQRLRASIPRWVGAAEFLRQVWARLGLPERENHVFGTDTFTVGTSPSVLRSPFFVHDLRGRAEDCPICVPQAGSDDGDHAGGSQATESFYDTGYGRMPTTTGKSERGVTDHVSKRDSVACKDYRFGWTNKTAACEVCGRHIHIWIQFFYAASHSQGYRICRKHLSPRQYEAFEQWVKEQW
jgi:hypothetical protein